jgi:ABC-type transport system involved in multi-copper enzyme maturation permease subunit
MLTVAHLTLSEARRRRIVLAAVLCATAFLLVFGVAVYFAAADIASRPRSFIERQAAFSAMTLAGLYAANFLSVLLAVLLPVDALSGEIDSGVMQTLASKPIRRGDIVLGKWLGHVVLVQAYLVALTGGVLLVVRIFSGFTPLHLERALPLMALETTLLAAVSIAGGTRLSTVTNGVACLGFYGIAFLGGWIEQFGTIAGVESARMVGIVASLISPPDAMWRLASWLLLPAVVRDVAPVVFAGNSVPTRLMVAWAIGFTVCVLAWAVRSFSRRAL